MADETKVRKLRQCEVCGYQWTSREGYIWIVLCPKCGVSGYHQPKELLRRTQ